MLLDVVTIICFFFCFLKNKKLLLFLRDLDLSLRNKNLGNQLEKFERQSVVLF